MTDVLVDTDVGVGVLLGGRDGEGVGWRPIGAAGPVQFEAGGAAADQTEVADDLAVDALEDEGGAGVVAAGGAAEIGGVVEPLGDEAIADERLRRAPRAPPEPTVLTGEGHVVLPRLAGPGAGAVFSPAHLHDTGLVVTVGDAPVEAVAAHVHQPAAALGEGVNGVPHGGGVVLGVAAGHDAGVALEQ